MNHSRVELLEAVARSARKVADTVGDEDNPRVRELRNALARLDDHIAASAAVPVPPPGEPWVFTEGRKGCTLASIHALSQALAYPANAATHLMLGAVQVQAARGRSAGDVL